MLKKVDLTQKMDKQEYAELMTRLRPELVGLQQQVNALGIPVMILFEGPRAAGKVTALGSVILNFDPRSFKVYSTREPEGGDLRKPWLWRFAKKAPARGNIVLFDLGWYHGARLEKKHSGGKNKRYYQEINTFERQLTDDGCLIIKIFLPISKEEQRKRFAKMSSHISTSWQVTKRDRNYLKNFGKNRKKAEAMLQKTNTPWAPWHIIPAMDKRFLKASVMQTVATELKKAVIAKRSDQRLFASTPEQRTRFTLLPAPRMQDIDLSRTVSPEEYTAEKTALQLRLRELHNLLYSARIPMVICYEGSDAAGKGGNIKRISQALDPRGYAVNPIAAPSSVELSHQFLWRFLHGLPRTGHIAIFDRTWYGRVLVERVEGITAATHMPQCYDEINEFEYMLHKWGALLLKFWVAVDKDEQLKRFEARQNTPEKQWKITDEDWRNREKWDAYQLAINDMFQYTNTSFAPWMVVESNSKQYARLKTLRAVVRAIEDRLC